MEGIVGRRKGRVGMRRRDGSSPSSSRSRVTDMITILCMGHTTTTTTTISSSSDRTC